MPGDHFVPWPAVVSSDTGALYGLLALEREPGLATIACQGGTAMIRLTEPRPSALGGGRVLRAIEGRISCPRRGDLDADACTCCRWLVDVDADDELSLVCSWVPGVVDSFEELRRPL